MDPKDQSHGPYTGMKVVLRRDGASSWHMAAVLDDEVVSAVVLDADEPTALSRAETLAGWFDAELVVERVGA